MSGPVEPIDPGGTGGPGEPDGPAPGDGPWPPVDDDDAVPYERDGDGTTPVRPGAGRARGRRRHPWRIAALVVIVVGLVVLVGGYAWVQSEASPSGPPGPPVLVTVPAGAGVNSTGSLLADKGVISSSLAFRIWTQFHSLPGVQAGPYLFHRRSSFDAVERVLAAGPNVFPVVVPPGFTVSELAQRVGQLPGHDAERVPGRGHQRGRAVARGSRPGSPAWRASSAPAPTPCFPARPTASCWPRWSTGSTPWPHAWAWPPGPHALGFSPYQVVTVASVVEKEGVYLKNMGPVSRVIYNRLAAGTPLQMDSTVLYALGRDGGPVTGADLQTPSLYNTYLHKGLPPTPTCFPSEAALTAALHPPAGPWLYFVVVQKDGTEAFSTTFAGQLANEALARQRGVG